MIISPAKIFRFSSLYASVAFTPHTNNATSNDVATLGLIGTTIGTSVPTAETIATAEIVDGKIAITSVRPGTFDLNVYNAIFHSATIPVTVAADGTITLGAIQKTDYPFVSLVNKLIDSRANNQFGLSWIKDTAVSDNTSVATVVVNDTLSKLEITSVSVGTAIITVTDYYAPIHKATVNIKVETDGTVTAVKFNPYME